MQNLCTSLITGVVRDKSTCYIESSSGAHSLAVGALNVSKSASQGERRCARVPEYIFSIQRKFRRAPSVPLRQRWRLVQMSPRIALRCLRRKSICVRSGDSHACSQLFFRPLFRRSLRRTLSQRDRGITHRKCSRSLIPHCQ